MSCRWQTRAAGFRLSAIFLIGLFGALFGSTSALADTSTVDLSITITGPSTAGQSTAVTYALTVTNLSTTVTATGVSVSVPWPTNLAGPQIYFTSSDLPPFSCAFGGGATALTTCSLGSLTPGQVKNFTLSGIANGISGTWPVTATVSSDSPDPDTSNNSATQHTQLHPSAFLRLTMSAPADATHNQTFSYQLGVSNLGPGDSAGASVDDTLPSTLAYQSATTSVGTCSTSPVSSAGGPTTKVHCELGPLANGASATITITVQVNGGVGPTTNTASVSGSDGNTNVNPTAQATTILSRAEVSATLVAPATAITSSSFTDVVTVTNAGPDDATIDLSLIFNAFGATMSSPISVTTSVGSCPAFSGSDFSAFTNCAITLNAGQSATINLTLSATISGTTPGGVSFSASAQMPNNRYDSNTSNNLVSGSTRLVLADATAALTSSPNPSHAGATVLFTISVTPDAPATATPTGAVRLMEGTTQLDSATLSGGAATLSLTTLSVGTHTIRAEYLGSNNFRNAASPTLSQVILPDVTPPSIIAPDAVTVSTALGQCSAAPSLGAATATDNVAVASITNNAPASFTRGTTVVIWTATDTSGNTATANQLVTVNDLESPSIVAPANVRLTSSSSSGRVIVAAEIGTATASDNCPGVTLTLSGVPAGNLFPIGQTTLTWIATDAAGNRATATQQVEVGYALCLLYDPTKAKTVGSTVPIKFQLCAGGANRSAAAIIVHVLSIRQTSGSASGVLEDSGNANPDVDFRYDPTLGGTGGYIFNLSSKSLTIGTWEVVFTAEGLNYSTTFQLK